MQDAARMAEAARSGESLVFFPEGTFTRAPGLGPFRLGAFVAAAGAGLPVVPVALRGTRSVLRSGHWFPRRGRIEVEFLAPVIPTGNDWQGAIGLRDAVRAAILKECAEPDLIELTTDTTPRPSP
jgi:1-acyl-sn-glycerol-3-phosphate acyltransferase